MKSNKILSFPGIGKIKKATPKKRVSRVKKGISGSLYQKFQEVAKKTKFTLRGASLPAFLKWMNANAKELFGKSIATKKWFTLLDEYPQIMDVMASAQIDTEPLEDESEVKVERYYAKVKKKSDKIGSVSKKIGSTKLDMKDFIGKSFSIELGSSGTSGVWNKEDFIEQIGRVLLHNFYDDGFAYSEFTDLGGVYRRNVINSSVLPLIKPNRINKTLNDFFEYDYRPYSTREKVLFFKLKGKERLKWIDNWFKNTKNNPPKITNMNELKKEYYNYRLDYFGEKPYTI